MRHYLAWRLVRWVGDAPSGSTSSTTLLALLYVALLVSVNPSPSSDTANPASVTLSRRFCSEPTVIHECFDCQAP